MTDHKILASWNGLTIGALARASHLLNEPAFLDAAKNAHHFIATQMWNEETQHLHHCSCDGKLDSLPQAESHLYLLRGTRQLYEATLDPTYLTFAIKLADATVKNFHDEKNGGFYNSAANPNLILRLKGDYDGATPTVSSIAALEFLLLAEITGRADFQKIGQGTLTAHQRTFRENPSALSEMLTALPLLNKKPATLVLTKGEDSDLSLHKKLLTASYQTPNLHLVRLGSGHQSGPINDLAKNTPATKTAQAILCKNNTCLPAITDAEALAEALTKDE